jgi:hypothetical protein
MEELYYIKKYIELSDEDNKNIMSLDLERGGFYQEFFINQIENNKIKIRLVKKLENKLRQNFKDTDRLIKKIKLEGDVKTKDLEEL